MSPTIPPEKVPAAAVVCPACGSANVQTTSKTIDASTYWRCMVCGEIWNVARREVTSRFSYGR